MKQAKLLAMKPLTDFGLKNIRHYARVTSIRRHAYVEFDYILGDPDLAVELVMPLFAFNSFCADRLCEISASSSEARDALIRLDQSRHPRSRRFASISIRETAV